MFNLSDTDETNPLALTHVHIITLWTLFLLLQKSGESISLKVKMQICNATEQDAVVFLNSFVFQKIYDPKPSYSHRKRYIRLPKGNPSALAECLGKFFKEDNF